MGCQALWFALTSSSRSSGESGERRATRAAEFLGTPGTAIGDVGLGVATAHPVIMGCRSPVGSIPGFTLVHVEPALAEVPAGGLDLEISVVFRRFRHSSYGRWIMASRGALAPSISCASAPFLASWPGFRPPPGDGGGPARRHLPAPTAPRQPTRVLLDACDQKPDVTGCLHRASHAASESRGGLGLLAIPRWSELPGPRRESGEPTPPGPQQ